MLPKRIEEILASPRYHEVLYNNQSVLIEKLNKEESTATVRINNSGENMVVPVVNLTETGKIN
jgi:H-type small acid-soluble spore protein